MDRQTVRNLVDNTDLHSIQRGKNCALKTVFIEARHIACSCTHIHS